MIPLASQLTLKILGIYFDDERRRYYVNQLAKIIQDDPSNVYKKLVWLKKKGILSDKFSNRERYFFLNKRYKQREELEGLLRARLNFSPEKVLLKRCGELNGAEAVYILDCASKRVLQKAKTLDMLIVGKVKTKASQKLFEQLEKELKKDLNVVCLTKKELKDKSKKQDPFLNLLFSKPRLKIM